MNHTLVKLLILIQHSNLTNLFCSVATDRRHKLIIPFFCDELSVCLQRYALLIFVKRHGSVSRQVYIYPVKNETHLKTLS